VWTAYSPQRQWSDIVREFLEASTKAKQGDTAPLEGFVNETLGQVWEQTVERADEHVLARRAEDYRLKTCPMGVLALVAGIDVQDNRWHVVVWGIGRGNEMWIIDRAEIFGNPSNEEEWAEKLDPFLASLYPHASGQVLPIEAAGGDTMGHFTHQAYNYFRLRERRKLYALRGDPAPGKEIGGRCTIQDVNYRGKILKRGVKLWYVGTDTAKDLIYGRLQVLTPGPGYMHFSKDLPPEFYAQLTSESRVEVRTSKGIIYRWENLKHARNEDLDCTVYALFVAVRLNFHTYTSAMWDRLEQAVQPATASLFAAAPAANIVAPSSKMNTVPVESVLAKARQFSQPPRRPSKITPRLSW
jgi:terminase, large subunit